MIFVTGPITFSAGTDPHVRESHDSERLQVEAA